MDGTLLYIRARAGETVAEDNHVALLVGTRALELAIEVAEVDISPVSIAQSAAASCRSGDLSRHSSLWAADSCTFAEPPVVVSGQRNPALPAECDGFDRYPG